MRDNAIEWRSAREFYSARRLDLMAKYTYVEYKDKGYKTSWAKELYQKHIEAFSGGNYTEPGKENEKNSLEAYVNTFDKLIEEIKNDRFDQEISVVPYGNNHVILDGAHRTSVAMYYDKKLPYRFEKENAASYGYAFFEEHLLERRYNDFLVLKYIQEKKENIFVLCVWPRAVKEGKSKAVERILEEKCEIVAKKAVKFTYNGLRNFMIQAYEGQTWLGGVAQHYKGIEGKVDPCYADKHETQIYVLEVKEPEKNSIVDVKEEVRAVFGIGKHACHSSDNEKETLCMAQLLFNENSIHLMNNGKFDYDPELVEKLLLLKEKVLEQNKSLENYIVDSSSIMGLYGIRKTGDVDYIALDGDDSFQKEGFDNNNNQLNYYSSTADQLIMNPCAYVYFYGMKIITLPILMKFKQNRGKKKDIEDVQLIKDKISQTNSFRQKLQVQCIRAKRGMRNFRTKVRDWLQSHNIYFFTKLWHLMRGKGFRA